MSSSSSRAPLVLALVIAAGFGARALRDAHASGANSLDSVAALDSQRARVQAVASSPSGSRAKRPPRSASAKARSSRTSKTGRSGSSEKRAAQPSTGRLRVERTPIGAIPAEVLAERARDSVRRLQLRGGGAGRGGRATASQPPAPRALIDVESASAEELDQLPGIGPALASRIVADREALGPFGSLTGLQRVRGIGPALARRLRARVTFSGTGRP